MTASAARLKLETSDAPESPPSIEPLLTAVEVGHILSVRPKRVYELGIPAVRISAKSLRWRRSVVAAWLDAHSEGDSR